MKTIDLLTFHKNSEYYIKKASDGALFVYPTDTIYGIWWIVTPEIIKKISLCKKRLAKKNYSIIAPSFTWIKEYFEVSEKFEKERYSLYKIHWPITTLLPLKNEFQNFSNFNVLSWNNLIWIRLIKHAFQEFVKILGQPIITTSVNISWTPSTLSIDNIPWKMKWYIDFAIDDWILNGKGSRIIDYTTWKIIR